MNLTKENFLESVGEDAKEHPSENHIKKPPTKEELTECLIEAVKKVMAWKNVEAPRLKRQVATCLKMVEGIVEGMVDGMSNGHKNFVVSAPTGFGKTILGLLISEFMQIATDKGLLDDVGSSYILTPNKFLQDQYTDDIVKFELTKTHAQLKGQSNYPCLQDYTKTFATRPCSKISVSKLPKAKSCGKDCPYVVARTKAIESRVTVFNYNYFLTSMNHTYEVLKDFAPFKPRGLTIFDECHTIAPIVQDMFKTELDLLTLGREIGSVFNLTDSLYGSSLMSQGTITLEQKTSVLQATERIIKRQDILVRYAHQVKKNINVVIFQNILDELKSLRDDFDIIIKVYSKVIADNFPKEDSDIKPTDDQEKILKHVEGIQEKVMRLNMLEKMYVDVGVDTMVVDIEKKVERQVERTYTTFRCVKDAELILRHAMKYTDYTILMSATIGETREEINKFANSHGIENPYIIVNKSDFDFSKSPIVCVTPQLKMTYKEKEKNMPMMLQRIEYIVKNHPKQAGLIHTGNYEFMKLLRNYAEAKGIDDRFIWCDTAKKKTQAVKQLKWDLETEGWTNRVLVGASLLEGIDLKDDMCRFNIFMKVPYPSMADELVKRKMKIYEGWYEWATMVSIQQGIGRSNRNKNDWSITYLLDGSFNGFFYRYGKVPSIISHRLVKADLTGWFTTKVQSHTPVVQSKPMPIEDEQPKIDIKPSGVFGGFDENSIL